MSAKAFSLADAETKLQKRVLCTHAFKNVPAGAAGKIIHLAPGNTGYELAIRWELGKTPSAIPEIVVWWISKEQYEIYVAEIGENDRR